MGYPLSDRDWALLQRCWQSGQARFSPLRRAGLEGLMQTLAVTRRLDSADQADGAVAVLLAASRSPSAVRSPADPADGAEAVPSVSLPRPEPDGDADEADAVRTEEQTALLLDQLRLWRRTALAPQPHRSRGPQRDR